MFAAGLMEMPPVSKQTPLPMNATGAMRALAPFQRITAVRLSRVEPWPTASSVRMPSFLIAGTSRISTETPSFFRPAARRANSSG